MNREQWESFLSRDNQDDSDWAMALRNANWWCSCAVGAKILGDKAWFIMDDNKSKEETSIASGKIFCQITNTDLNHLGGDFYTAISNKDLKNARKIFEKVMDTKI